MEHTNDPRRWRVTFGLSYPTVDASFETKSSINEISEKENEDDSKVTVAEKRLSFPRKFLTFSKTAFRRCNFHNEKGKSFAEISHVTFEHCDFVRNIMGTTVYEGVHFSDCVFEQCDFQYARFIDCRFVNCEFSRCSGYRVEFSRTELPPAKFLASYQFPSTNFSEVPADEQTKWKERWLEVRLETARQLFRSANECHHSLYADEGLCLLKTAELELSQEIAKQTGEFRRKLLNALSWLNLVATRGGTSLGRLLWFAGALIFVVLLVVIAFLPETVDFMGRSLAVENLSGLSISWYLHSVVAAGATFLAFGFTGWSLDSTWALLVTAGTSTIGLAWYALAIPVLIRRVYR